MRLDEFRRIKLKVLKNGITVYEGEAEEIPDNMKDMNTKEIKIQPGLAEVVLEDENIPEEL